MLSTDEKEKVVAMLWDYWSVGDIAEALELEESEVRDFVYALMQNNHSLCK